MASLICGSIAYDTIMSFEGRFAEQILPEQIHILNVAFLVPHMRREFGGCAGNIAYNLKLLQGDPYIMATVGGDAGPYFDQLNKFNISTEFVRKIPDAFTAQAMITTDRDNNQITAFHPGAMSESHLNSVLTASLALKSTPKAIQLGIVAPDGRDGMLIHAQQFVDAQIPFIFDPGQGLPMFDSNDLNTFIEQATYIAVNDYEGEMLSHKTGLPLAQIAKRVKALIVTKGVQGSEIYTDGQVIHIPVVSVEKPVDPTGCGDAFRAGLLYGIENQLDMETTGRLGSLMGAIKIASQGPQNHAPSFAMIQDLYRKAFNADFI
ncbi:MAG: carbohydrate kinase family protein [Betaproteobacteria bacterium]